MTRKIQIFDTTLRDGEQSPGASMNAEEKLIVARQLIRLGVDGIEAGFPASSPGDMRSVSEIGSLAGDHVIVSAFARAVDSDIEAAAEALKGVARPRITTGIGVSPIHLKEKLGISEEECVEQAVHAVTYAKSFVDDVEFFVEDAGRADEAFLIRVVQAVVDAGATVVNIPDTTGFCLPEDWAQRIKAVMDGVTGIENVTVSVHAHNDLGMATALSLAGVRQGATQVECTINGLGERAGNAALASVQAVLKDHLHVQTHIDESRLGEVSHLVESYSGIAIPPNKPITGESVFTQVAGVHADGDNKAGLYQNALLPERFGRKREYALGKNSGKANILRNLEELGLELSPEQTKRVTERIIELGDKKELVTQEDLPYIVSDVLKHGAPEEHVKLLSYVVTTAYGLKPLASVRLEVNGETYEESAKGDGQFDAFVRAIRHIYKNRLGRSFPWLTNYTVSIPPGGRTDALVQTVITWNWNDRILRTRGLDADQTEAAIKSTIKMLNLLEEE